MNYIDEKLFIKLKQTTLSCGSNIGGYIYINHFDNKERMTATEFFNLKRDVVQELKTNRTIKTQNLYDKYNKPRIMYLKELLNIT
jgi:hypothetical protein